MAKRDRTMPNKAAVLFIFGKNVEIQHHASTSITREGLRDGKLAGPLI
jgi:hypothetical protein